MDFLIENPEKFHDGSKGIMLHVEVFRSVDRGLSKLTAWRLPIKRWSTLPEDMVAFKNRRSPKQTKDNISSQHVYVDITVSNARRKNIKFGIDTTGTNRQRKLWLNQKCLGTPLRTSLNYFFKVVIIGSKYGPKSNLYLDEPSGRRSNI